MIFELYPPSLDINGDCRLKTRKMSSHTEKWNIQGMRLARCIYTGYTLPNLAGALIRRNTESIRENQNGWSE
jgi:hypothetical protein